LFFQVLAVKPEDRGASVKSKFAKIPYLNSSLFEMSGLEDDLIRISNLEDDPVIPIISKTVLKHTDGKKKSGKISSLQYLFDFLDSYDFSSEGSEDIQEERKTLINASVLGLIFEKINGYKDGSFFTPGFITMYMSRETIRRAVIQKFNDTYKVNIKDFGELKNFVGLPYKKDEIKKYNEVINSLKICDPAVGSGHFLVSVLNEIIAVKSELNLLSDSEGNRLIGYSAFVENDELTLVNTMSGDLFEYKPGNHESQRIQEALFHEKQTIIENCLFGVDINHNSVKICRLRLWIELLKNAYYTKESNHKELETLPNIDINIKCGNSLVSRFSLDADLSSALRKSKWTITSYRLAVQSYQNAKTKDEKRELEKLLNEIKSNFRTEISDNDPKHKRLERLEGELYEKYTSNKLLSVSLTDKEKAKEEKDKLKLQADIEKLKSEIKEIKESAIYRNAFEWRFEFPEVLDEKGSFIGFDVVIGNPPYFQIQKLDVNINSVKGNYKTYEQMGDIYVLFYERGYNILSKKGILNFITSNKWLRANYGNSLRKFLINYTNCLVLIDFNYYQVFEEASVDTNILSFLKGKSDKIKSAVSIREGFSVNEINDYVSLNSKEVSGLTENYWNVSTDDKTGKLNSKLNSLGIKLKNWNINFNRGVLTGFNDAFIIDKKTKEFLISEDKNNIELIMPYLRGRDIKRYSFNHEDLWLIF
ncbi:MAG: Eco57I restriction-modification methylase domain-containing protein, partial [Candidatus Delongbacteria bacterium]|nr:Eco57I restriction-modification methylase domain-containing protein [Candidatus Delongbacteria bacterium]